MGVKYIPVSLIFENADVHIKCEQTLNFVQYEWIPTCRICDDHLTLTLRRSHKVIVKSSNDLLHWVPLTMTYIR